MHKVEITGVDTSKLKTLSNEEQQELLRKIKDGDMQAREKMIAGNLKLVLSVLKRFNDRKESMDDLFQVGCIGLMKAIDNFDLSHNVRFSTYACPMIIGEVRRHLRDNGAIRVSRSYKDIAYKAIGYKDKFLLEHHREPSINEIAEHLNVDSVDVILALEAIQDTISMSTPIYDNGGDVIELEDQIGGTDYITENWMRNNMIKEAFSKLSKREQAIIYDRYYLDKTQMEIAEELSISQAQVSRLEKNALKIMYDYMQ
ncbi:MAG: SigB/SigF/SigG family RNA polymerase sigma factor [Anaeroplasmataceae bacterium]|nr:SigB/SigF/SigG family RNA polymerase sigma factor [Anaeroplasmataceae bacterium]